MKVVAIVISLFLGIWCWIFLIQFITNLSKPMILIPVFQTTVFSLYVWWIIKQFGILPSISQSWYEEANVNGKRKKFMFILFIISISAATLLLYTKSLWFLGSGASLLIVALAPAFRSEHKIVGVLHTGGTVLGIAFACYALATQGIYFTTVLCVVGSILPERLRIANTTFWVEIITFGSIMLGIFQLITLGI